MANVTVHPDLATAWDRLRPERCSRSRTRSRHTDIAYQPGDVLFGPEPTGLPDDVVTDPHITGTVRIPMLPDRRSHNLANATSIAIYEAWRQNDFAGAVRISRGDIQSARAHRRAAATNSCIAHRDRDGQRRGRGGTEAEFTQLGGSFKVRGSPRLSTPRSRVC